MNLLPFVFTMLLLLALMNSFIFSSFIRTSREKEVILSEHLAYLQLLSKQNQKIYKKKRPPPKEPPGGGENLHPEKKQKKPKDPKVYFREHRQGCHGSKLNLAPMIDGKSPQLRQALEEIFIRLMDILYGPYEFYQTAQRRKIIPILVQKIIQQKINAFENLELDSEELDEVYYKMLKGTNTSYPPLTEYCMFDKKSEEPICFKYATTSILRAALGQELAENLIERENTSGEKRKMGAPLNKEEFEQLARGNASLIPTHLFNEIFNYEYVKKGLPQIEQSGSGKVRALHETDFEKE